MNIGVGAIGTKRKRMKTKNNHKQVGDLDGFDEGTYRLEVCNESSSTSNKVVRTKTMNVRLLREVPNDWRSKNHQPYVS